jgi:hypothetical protein
MMRNWVTIGLVAIGSLMAVGAAFADVPSSLTSDVTCYCTADPASGGASLALPNKCTISSSGGAGGTDPSDDLHVDVIVRNVLSQPLVGSTVTAQAVAFGGTVAVWDDGVSPPITDTPENPQTGVSGALGDVAFVFDEGGLSIPLGGGAAANMDLTVNAQGPGPGLPVLLENCTPDLTVHAFDLDADAGCDVDLIDFGFFGSYFVGGDTRADFNHVGGVTLADFGLFAANFGADCQNQ